MGISVLDVAATFWETTAHQLPHVIGRVSRGRELHAVRQRAADRPPETSPGYAEHQLAADDGPSALGPWKLSFGSDSDGPLQPPAGPAARRDRATNRRHHRGPRSFARSSYRADPPAPAPRCRRRLPNSPRRWCRKRGLRQLDGAPGVATLDHLGRRCNRTGNRGLAAFRTVIGLETNSAELDSVPLLMRPMLRHSIRPPGAVRQQRVLSQVDRRVEIDEADVVCVRVDVRGPGGPSSRRFRPRSWSRLVLGKGAVRSTR